MRAPWLFALAVVATVGTPRPLHAQRRSTGTRSPVTPAARPAPPVRRPVGTITTAPASRGGLRHQVCVFRSSIFGLFAIDPYWWLAPDVVDDNMAPLPSPMSPAGPPLKGGLQLDVEPRRAFVYLDGVPVGTVDQFKGYFQHLETAAGYHLVEFVAPDFDPLIAEVIVAPNTTTTYRAFLNRAGGR